MSLKAFLLSALVFPGLGQIYNKDQRKGILIILFANLLAGITVLAGLVLFSQEYLAVYYPKPLTGDIVRAIVGEVLTHLIFLIPGALLVGLWAFAAVDAGLKRGAPPPEE